MTVVTNLVAQLGFRVNTAQLNQFNRQIGQTQRTIQGTANGLNQITRVFNALIGMPSIGAIFGAGAGFSVSSILNSSSDAVLSAEKIAASTGTVLENFASMREAASKFRIPRDSFDAGFTRLNELVLDARTGFGKLNEIAGLLGVNIRKENKEIENTGEIFLRLVDAINQSTETVESKIARFNMILPGFGRELYEFASNGRKGIEDLSKEFDSFGKTIASNVEDFKKYQSNMSEFYSNLKEIQISLGNSFVPILNDIYSSIKSRSAAPVGFYVDKMTGNSGTESNLEKNTSPISVTNNINIEVPEGTNIDQALYIKNQVMEVLEDNNQELVRSLQISSPWVE